MTHSWLSSGSGHIWNISQKTPATDWERQMDDLLNRQAAAIDPAERVRLVAALGAGDGLILENHGTLIVGRTVAEARALPLKPENAVRFLSENAERAVFGG